MLSIYEYANAADYLKDAWIEKRNKNTAFSMRSWAQTIGFKNNAPLSLMLNGKRPITKKYIPQFVKSLNLSEKEGMYLEVLVDLGSAKSQAQKELYTQRIKSLGGSHQFKFHEVDSFKTISEPIYSMIIEMTDLKGFKNDSVWIQERLNYKYSISEIDQVIERLLQLGLLKKNSQDTLVKTNQHVTTKPDIRDQAAQEYHKKIALMSVDAIKNQSVVEREFNGFSMNMKKTDIQNAKQKIRHFIKEFIDEFESKPSEGEENYQFNIQLFANTQKGARHEKK